jgi:predicted RNase H-like HicB family nuclease
MQQQGYHMLFKKAEEGGFIGRCLELPAAITQGETMEELRANMKEAIELVQESILEEAKQNREQVIEVSL